MDLANQTQSIKQFLSIGEAAEYLGVSIDTLRRWAKAGKISDTRSPGGHRYFRKTDLDNLFNTKYERYNEPKFRKPTSNLNANTSTNNSNGNSLKFVTKEIKSNFNISESDTDSNISKTVYKHQNNSENININVVDISQQNNSSIENYKHTRPPRKVLIPTTPVISIRKSANYSIPHQDQNNLISTPIYGTNSIGIAIPYSNKLEQVNDGENRIKKVKKILLIIFAVFILADIIFIILWYITPKLISPIP